MDTTTSSSSCSTSIPGGLRSAQESYNLNPTNNDLPTTTNETNNNKNSTTTTDNNHTNSSNGNGPTRDIRKRNRVPVSCRGCRERKLRCDRKTPRCSRCVTLDANCVYASKVNEDDKKDIMNGNNNSKKFHPYSHPHAPLPSRHPSYDLQYSNSNGDIDNKYEDDYHHPHPHPQQFRNYNHYNYYNDHHNNNLNHHHNYYNNQYPEDDYYYHNNNRNNRKELIQHFNLSYVGNKKQIKFIPRFLLRFINANDQLDLLSSLQDFYSDTTTTTKPIENSRASVLSNVCSNLLPKDLNPVLTASILDSHANYILTPSKSKNISISTLLYFLPPRDLCYYLADRYFLYVNSLFYLITKDFYKKIELVLKFSETNNPSTIKNIEDEIDYSLLALIFIVLRLGQLSFGNEWIPSKNKRFPKEYDNFVGRHLYYLSEYCISTIGFLQDNSLNTIQVLLGFKLHEYMDTNSNLSQSISNPLTGILCTKSMSLGLHLDPSHFNNVTKEDAHTWRIVFGMVIILDTCFSLENGLPFSLNLKYSDTDIFLSKSKDGENPNDLFRSNYMKFVFLTRDIMDHIFIIKNTNNGIRYNNYNDYYYNDTPGYHNYNYNYHNNRNDSETYYFFKELDIYENGHMDVLKIFLTDLSSNSNGSSNINLKISDDPFNSTQGCLIIVMINVMRIHLLQSLKNPNRIEIIKSALKIHDIIISATGNKTIFMGYEYFINSLCTRFYYFIVCIITNNILYNINNKVWLLNDNNLSKDLLISIDEENLLFNYDIHLINEPNRLLQSIVKITKLLSNNKDKSIGFFKIYKLCNNCLNVIANKLILHYPKALSFNQLKDRIDSSSL